MLVLIAFGVMNLAAMIGVAIVIAIERCGASVRSSPESSA